MCGYICIHILIQTRMGQPKGSHTNETTCIIIYSPPALSVFPLFTGASRPDYESTSTHSFNFNDQIINEIANEIAYEIATTHCSVSMLTYPSDEVGPSP